MTISHAARRGWLLAARLALGTAIIVGVVIAIYAERTTIREGIEGLAHVRLLWLLTGFAAECLSMLTFARLEQAMLRASGAGHTLRSVLSTAYTANAIAMAVPVVGSGLATAYAYRDFRRDGADPEQVSMALTVSGGISSIAFAVVVGTGALLTGNLAAAIATAGSAVAVAVVVVAFLLALRFAGPRDWLIPKAAAVLRQSKRLFHRPLGDPGELVTTAFDQVGALRLGSLTGSQAFGFAMINWLADVACLACCLEAAGASIPWRAILIVWSAGAGAASFSPVPAGLGVVEVVLVAALIGSGLHGAPAVGAVLLYRIIGFKIILSGIWITYHWLHVRRGAVLSAEA
jgi:putative heme transporter